MLSLKKHIKKIWKIIFIVLIVSNIYIWYAVYHTEASKILSVYFLDVGQGDAILIKSPTGNKMLIDAGPDKTVLGGIAQAMPLYDKDIEVILATHADADHIGGFVSVLDRFNVDFIIGNGIQAQSRVFDRFEELAEKSKAERIVAKRGMTIDLGGGATLLILFPDRDVSGLDSNDASIVAKLFFGKTSFMLTGDSPKKIEEYLVSLDKNKLQSNVLKVGHHGSKTSSSPLFIQLVEPKYTVIQAGKNNSYGHPNSEVLETLSKTKAKILGTYDLGTIVIQSDGENLKIQN